MLEWIKRNTSVLVTAGLTVGLLIFIYGCEPKTLSLTRPDERVNRAELQLELDQLIGLAQLRMIDLDKQEQFRAIILQNALVLVQGQPFNPFGLISAVAALYGLTQVGGKVSSVVKTSCTKRKVNNG